MPKVQFRDAKYTGNENDGKITAIIYRSGDLRYRSSVRCYSRQGSAQVMMDFNERPNTDASIVTFLPGQPHYCLNCSCSMRIVTTIIITFMDISGLRFLARTIVLSHLFIYSFIYIFTFNLIMSCDVCAFTSCCFNGIPKKKKHYLRK